MKNEFLRSTNKNKKKQPVEIFTLTCYRLELYANFYIQSFEKIVLLKKKWSKNHNSRL